MLGFLKYTFATVVGVFLFFVILFLIGYSFVPDDTVSLDEKSVLVLKLRKPILERAVENPLDEVAIPIGMAPGGDGLVEIKKAIRRAQDDPKIEGILLHLSGVRTGFAIMEEIRNTLLEFKTREKFVYAYGDYYSEGAYYLASVADKIFLNAEGLIEFDGLTIETEFYAKGLAKLGVKPLVFKVGAYKNYAEPYTASQMSAETKEQYTSFLNSIYDFYLKQVAEARGLDEARLEEASDNFMIQTAEDALEYKLVTDVASYETCLEMIAKEMDEEEAEDVSLVPLSTYLKAPYEETNMSRNRIAVIVCSGEIGLGRGDEESIGSETVVEELRKARKSKRIQAIVLRINSPGGSAFASDLIWQEVIRTKKEKPVIASISDYGTSGGYYMAMACDKILAQPNTVTGSIGVVSVLFDVQGLVEGKLGITYDRVSTGNYAEIRSALLTRDLKEKEKAYLQESANRVYLDFISKAAKGRDMPVDSIDVLAGGRVWTGIQALELGLIDQLGSLDDAVEIAAEAAELEEDDYRVRFYPIQKSFYEKLADNLSVKSPQWSQQFEGEVPALLRRYYEQLQRLEKMGSVQAYFPAQVTID